MLVAVALSAAAGTYAWWRAVQPPPPAPVITMAPVTAMLPDPPPPPPAPVVKPKPKPAVAAAPHETFCDAGGGTATFHVVLDSIRARGEPGPMVAYAVCGLKAGAHYRTVITATRQESGLQKLLGARNETTEAYDDRAAGAAVRTHHGLPQLARGAYSLTLTVTDRRGRRREETAEFRLP
jgi:hypothetical protein